MISTTWLSLPCAWLREAITSCSWVRMERAAAAADIGFRLSHMSRFGNASPRAGKNRLLRHTRWLQGAWPAARRISRRSGRRGISAEAEFFLDPELLLLEGLNRRSVGSGPAHLIPD